MDRFANPLLLKDDKKYIRDNNQNLILEKIWFDSFDVWIKIAIIDYGINNILSVKKAFDKVQIETKVVTSKEELKKYKHLVLTGVGSFDWGIKNLQSQGLYDELKNLAEKGYLIMVFV